MKNVYSNDLLSVSVIPASPFQLNFTWTKLSQTAQMPVDVDQSHGTLPPWLEIAVTRN